GADVVVGAGLAVVAAGAVGLVAAVDAGLRARQAGGRSALADAGVAGARDARRAGDARAGAVADHVGAAGGAGRSHRVVVAHHRSGHAAGDAGEARVRVGRARLAGRADAAVAVAVAHHVGAAGDAGHLVAAI